MQVGRWSRRNSVLVVAIAGSFALARPAYAQEAEHSLLMVDTTNAVLAMDEVGGAQGSHRLTLGLGRSNVGKGQVDGAVQSLALTALSLDYDYWMADHWAVGIQTQGILESFVVQVQDDEAMERAYPVSMVPVLLYRPIGALALVAGAGAEFAGGSRTVALTRLGLEAGVPFGGRNWQMGAAVLWDNRLNYNNSWNISVTLSRVFGAGGTR
jgi:hypothetical protein